MPDNALPLHIQQIFQYTICFVAFPVLCRIQTVDKAIIHIVSFQAMEHPVNLSPDLLQRCSGIRKFTEKEIEILRVIECLKMSGLEIRDIRQFVKWCSEGSATYEKRYDLLQKRQAAVEAELEQMKKALDMICFKCWYYEQAMNDGNEERLNKMLPDRLPGEIQAMYNHAHKKSR